MRRFPSAFMSGIPVLHEDRLQEHILDVIPSSTARRSSAQRLPAGGAAAAAGRASLESELGCTVRAATSSAFPPCLASSAPSAPSTSPAFRLFRPLPVPLPVLFCCADAAVLTAVGPDDAWPPSPGPPRGCCRSRLRRGGREQASRAHGAPSVPDGFVHESGLVHVLVQSWCAVGRMLCNQTRSLSTLDTTTPLVPGRWVPRQPVDAV